jgi:hypothetical protein
MTEDETKQNLLQVCKVKGWDSDFNVLAFHVLCDKLKEFGAKEEREKVKGEIETLHAMYELASKQRDYLMEQQNAQVAAMRGRMQ